jgi:hypothetical protein
LCHLYFYTFNKNHKHCSFFHFIHLNISKISRFPFVLISTKNNIKNYSPIPALPLWSPSCPLSSGPQGFFPWTAVKFKSALICAPLPETSLWCGAPLSPKKNLVNLILNTQV